uniref:Uncharacterized protein n=1 Tax=Sphaerodactylus townsendi TaxID=933632 RepID=A0ACB8ETS2_9SAUR
MQLNTSATTENAKKTVEALIQSKPYYGGASLTCLRQYPLQNYFVKCCLNEQMQKNVQLSFLSFFVWVFLSCKFEYFLYDVLYEFRSQEAISVRKDAKAVLKKPKISSFVAFLQQRLVGLCAVTIKKVYDTLTVLKKANYAQ